MTLHATLVKARLDKDETTGWTRHNIEPGLDSYLDTLPLTYRNWPTITSVPKTKTKYLHPALDCSWGELARLYLQIALAVNGVKRVGYRREALDYLEWHDPVYYAGGDLGTNTGRMVVVDCTAAHWSILSPGTLDLVFRLKPGGGLDAAWGHIEPPRAGQVADLPKKVRLSITGNLARRTVERWRYNKPEHLRAPTNLLAPDAIAYIHLTLQAVAWEAVRDWRCRHVAMDSYIIPEDLAEPFIAWLADRWLLTGTVRARGEGRIYNTHQWEIRPHRPGDLGHSTLNAIRLHMRCKDPPVEPLAYTDGLIGHQLFPKTIEDLVWFRHRLAGRRRVDPGWID